MSQEEVEASGAVRPTGEQAPTTEEGGTISPEDIEAKLEELRASNMARLNSLQEQGYGMNPVLQLKLRMDTLTAWVVDDSISDAFELMYETMLAAELGEVESEVARMKILKPGT